MAAYYNEFDPFAAQWLRNLIKAGHIADGEVDERSIVDVEPSDLRGFTQCHFFAGIGGWSLALRMAGWPDSRPVWTGSPPASPSAQQASNSEQTTSDTLPPSGSNSLKPVDLSESLGSKLQQRLKKMTGSTLYKTHWRKKATPQGRSFYQLVASVPRTSGKDSGLWLKGWATPTANDFKGSGPTVIRKDGKDRTYDRLDYAAEQGLINPWPTPTASDGSGGGQAKRALNPERSNDLNDFVMLSGWPTPRATDGKNNARSIEGAISEANRKSWNNDLGVAAFAPWPTPVTADATKQGDVSPRPGAMALPETLHYLRHNSMPARLTEAGELLIGSTAEMESGGQLSPAHSRWLMGYPPEWDDCAVTVTLSSPRSQRK